MLLADWDVTSPHVFSAKINRVHLCKHTHIRDSKNTLKRRCYSAKYTYEATNDVSYSFFASTWARIRAGRCVSNSENSVSRPNTSFTLPEEDLILTRLQRLQVKWWVSSEVGECKRWLFSDLRYKIREKQVRNGDLRPLINNRVILKFYCRTIKPI